jgi:plasmid stabilization system protein ParE
MGDHGRELELASRCRRLHPDEPTAVLLEIRALAALGRASDAGRLIDQTRATPGGRQPGAGALFREAALELRAHGWAEAAEPHLERAVEWYEERAGEGASDGLRRELARSLYDAGRLDDAGALFRDLAEREGGRVRPVGHHHGHLQAHLDEGYLAVIAARTGDARETERWCAWLEELDGPFLYGAQWFWRAAVAAVLDEGDRAVTMLRRAFSDGLPLEMFLHTDPHLLRLRGQPSFDALMRPRG